MVLAGDEKLFQGRDNVAGKVPAKPLATNRGTLELALTQDMQARENGGFTLSRILQRHT